MSLSWQTQLASFVSCNPWKSLRPYMWSWDRQKVQGCTLDVMNDESCLGGNTYQWYHQGILWAYPPSQRFSSFRWSSLSLTHHLIWPEPPDSSSDVYQLCHFRSNLSQCVGMWRHAISWRILILLFYNPSHLLAQCYPASRQWSSLLYLTIQNLAHLLEISVYAQKFFLAKYTSGHCFWAATTINATHKISLRQVDEAKRGQQGRQFLMKQIASYCNLQVFLSLCIFLNCSVPKLSKSNLMQTNKSVWWMGPVGSK